MFPENSRYHNTEKTKFKTAEGKTIVYLQRRFVPPAENFDQIQEHTVTGGDRLDNVSARYLDDPELYWRVADANNAMTPAELTEQVGRKLRITLPEGIPGPANV